MFVPNNTTTTSSQITFLRKSHGSRLNVFAPVNDLSALSKTGNVDRAGTLLVAGQKNDVAIAGGQILGDEWSDHVVKVGRTELAGQRKRLICCEFFFFYRTVRVSS
jgi:hypothetical protein